jgi:phosphate uptake regulator
MEGRKLQVAGGSTYLVSLPRRWVLNAGLKAGDTLFLEIEGDGSVSVRHRAVEKPAIRRKIFEEKEAESREHLLRKLVGAYVSGFGLIEVRFPPDRGPFVRRVTREFCRLVTGPEVIEEHRNALVIQDLSDTSELSSDKCLRRMHLIVRAMLEDAVQALTNPDPALAQDVALRDQDVDRLYWMVSKQFHVLHIQGPGNSQAKESMGIHNHLLVAKLLERIGDHAERIARTATTMEPKNGFDTKLVKDLEEASRSAVRILDKAFHALVTGDIDEANETIDERDHHQKLIDALFHRVATKKGEELLAMGVVVDSLGRTASYAADIAEQAIDLAVLMEPKKPA